MSQRLSKLNVQIMLQILKSKVQNQLFVLSIPITLAILVRGLLLTRWCGDFNSDEAIVGLMAKHILAGRFPVFFYGQFYMGSQESMLAAVIFWLFGDMNGFLLRLSPITFYLAFIVLAFLWVQSWRDRQTALWATLMLALPPAALTNYTYGASAGYPELLFWGTLLFLLYQRSLKFGWSSMRVFSLALVAGLALWNNPLSIFYLTTVLIIWVLGSTWWPQWRAYLLHLPPIIYLIIGAGLLTLAILALLVFKLAVDVLYIQRLLISTILVTWIAAITLLRWQSRLHPNPGGHNRAVAYLFWLGSGGILGMVPMIYYFFDPGNSTGGADNFVIPTWQRQLELWRFYFTHIFPALIGVRTYIDSSAVVMFLAKIGIVVIFLAVIFLFSRQYGWALPDLILLRPITPQMEHFLWLLGGLTVVFGFINGNVYDLEHIRYFLPLLFVLSTLVGLALTHWQKYKPALAILLALFLLGFNGVTNFNYYQSLTTTCTAQEVVDYLLRKQIKGGQAYYEQAYKLTFLSHERVIIAPYRSRDRYEAYTHYAAALPQQIYILRQGSETERFLAEFASPADLTLETVKNYNIFTLNSGLPK
jgi:hypothetical protein